MHLVSSSIFTIMVWFFMLPPAIADDWDDADKAISRLSPRMFSELPTSVADELVKQGCTIPQPSAYIKGKTGVISGSFAKRGQKDYAVLCSKNGVSHIQVIWGGPIQCKSELEPLNDRIFLQTGSGGRINYSRAIGKVSQKTIASQHYEQGDTIPPDTSHDGIENAFVEKASTIFYCANGKWFDLAGAD